MRRTVSPSRFASAPRAGRSILAALLALGAFAVVGCANPRLGVRPLTASADPNASAVRLWPLLNIEPEPAPRPDLERLGANPRPGELNAFGPFLRYRWQTDAQGRRATFFGLHPLYSRTEFPNRHVGPDKSIYHEVIYPFLQTQWKKFGETIRTKLIVFPLWVSQKRVTKNEAGETETRKRSFLFPLWWQGSDDGFGDEKPAKGFSYLLPFWWRNTGQPHALPFFNPLGKTMSGLWPFYTLLNDYAGRTYWTFAFPLVVYSYATKGRPEGEPLHKALSLLWPIFRVQWGGGPKDAGEFRIWPLFGYQRAGEKFSFYLPWPLFMWRDASEEGKPDRSLVVFPFVISGDYKQGRYRIYLFNGWYEDEDESMRFVCWPFYTHWVNEKEQFEETQILWHLFRWRNPTGEKRNTYHQIYPLYRYVETENAKFWHHPFILWHGTERRKRGYAFHGRYSWPLFFNKWRDFDDGHQDWSRMVWPFVHWKGDTDGASHIRALWLLPQEALDGANRNWGPLWSLFSSDRETLREPDPDKPFDRAVPSIPADLERGDDTRRKGTVVGHARSFALLGHFATGYEVEGDSAPAQSEFHWNVGPFAYDRVNGEKAFSLLGGWFPLRWGTPDPAPVDAAATTSPPVADLDRAPANALPDAATRPAEEATDEGE
jgi:hypothetical protein